MYKFKKGDRVVSIKNSYDYKKGEVLIIDQDNSFIPYCRKLNGKLSVVDQEFAVSEEIYNSPLYKIMNEMEE